MTLAPRRRVGVATLATALAATLTLAGCGDEEPDLPTPVAPRTLPAAPEPSPTSTLDPAEAEAVDEVLAIYDGYLSTYTDLATDTEPPLDSVSSLLLGYTDQDVATADRNVIVQNFVDGRVFTGELSWTLLELIDVDLERVVDGEPVPQAVLQICVDGSTWELVDKSSGGPVGEPPGRYVSTVTAERRDEREFGPNGWALYEQDDDRSQPC